MVLKALLHISDIPPHHLMFFQCVYMTGQGHGCTCRSQMIILGIGSHLSPGLILGPFGILILYKAGYLAQGSPGVSYLHPCLPPCHKSTVPHSLFPLCSRVQTEVLTLAQQTLDHLPQPPTSFPAQHPFANPQTFTLSRILHPRLWGLGEHY